MASLGRSISAALVVIAMIAAQVMPAWAGCHAMKHTATAMMMDGVNEASVHHGKKHLGQAEKNAAVTGLDPATPSPADLCLGNCGCACSISGAFLLAGVMAIDGPHSASMNRPTLKQTVSLGRTPDGLRRPPRTSA